MITPTPARPATVAVRPRLSRLAAVAALAIASACGTSPEDPRDSTGEAIDIVDRCTPSSSAYVTRFDQPFATPGGDTLRLDLAIPSAPGPHPAVLVLHGGGWEAGDRTAAHGEMHMLAAQGYVAAAVQYRLSRAPLNVFPAAVRDVRCAVRWLRANAGTLKVDPARVGVVGYSAGAHLASMLGVGAAGGEDRSEGCLAGTTGGAAVQGVIAMAGPQDLRVDGPYTAEQARLVTNFLGVFPGDAPQVAERASPIAHVTAGSAPFLLVHGTRDQLVPVEHARRMAAALRRVGVPATLQELPEAGHGLPGLDSRGADSVACTALAFLGRWVRGA